MDCIRLVSLVPISDNGKQRGIYECSICRCEFVCNVANVKNKRTTKCRPCADRISGEAKKERSKLVLIDQFKSAHGNAYDYSKVAYNGNLTNVTIVCKVHGDFQQLPKVHKRGQGCPKCALASSSIRQTCLAATTFAADCSIVHSNKYDYTHVVYKNSATKVRIICPTHGEFLQLPSNHKAGQGCYQCGLALTNIALRQAVNSGTSTLLYYIYFPEFHLWKIGCTNKDIDKRFKRDKTTTEVLFTKVYDNSVEAYSVEAYLLDKTSSDKYVGDKLLQGGNTEIRTKAVVDFTALLMEAENVLALGLKKDTDVKHDID